MIVIRFVILVLFRGTVCRCHSVTRELMTKSVLKMYTSPDACSTAYVLSINIFLSRSRSSLDKLYLILLIFDQISQFVDCIRLLYYCLLQAASVDYGSFRRFGIIFKFPTNEIFLTNQR